MSGSGCTEAGPSLAALREAGARSVDPVRFHYLEVLSRRVDALQGDVHTLVQGKLQQALADYAARFERAQQAAADDRNMKREVPRDVPREVQREVQRGMQQQGMQRRAATTPATAVRPLAALNRYLQERTQDAGDGRTQSAAFDTAYDAESDGEMKSVRRFRQAWSRIAAEDQVELAAGRAPVNAGPLNSHMLVLRSLELMRDISPDYLQHFLAHADALLWLEQAQQKASPAAKPVRRNSAKKS